MSFPNDLKGYEKMAQMKNMLGVSLIDILKPNIKKKENENVIKMLDIVKDKPDAYLELLSVAIFHRNLEIMKLIIEKYINSEFDAPYMNALTFFNSIIPDDSQYQLTDSKNNYIEIMCPFVLMAGIGGDIEIFKYLFKLSLISDLNISGTIGLSKKFKNAFTSNIVGACAYYGNDKLLDYLLKNYRSELDINITSTEKKSKNTKIHFLKELTGASPPLLACAAPISDEKTIKILKILEDYKANFENKDFNDNNIIHITTRTKKIQTLKFLINSLELKDIMNDANNDNMTPFGIAQQMGNKDMISFFNSFGQIDENQIEENVKELIEDSNRKADRNKKKGKKNKNKNNDLPLLNSSEYQESLQVEETKEEKEEDNNSNNDDANEENIEENEEKDEDEDDINKDENEAIESKKERRYNNNKYNYNKYKKEYNYSKNYKYKNSSDNYNKNVDINNSSYNNNYNTNNYGYSNNYNNNYNNNNYNYKNYDNNYKTSTYDNYHKKKSSGMYKNTNQKGYYNNPNNSNYYRSQNSYNKKKYDNKNYQSYKRAKEFEEKEYPAETKEEEEQNKEISNSNSNNNNINDDNNNNDNNYNGEERKEQNNNNNNNNEENEQNNNNNDNNEEKEQDNNNDNNNDNNDNELNPPENNNKEETKKEMEEKNEEKEKEKEEEEEEEGSYSEEDFLNEKEYNYKHDHKNEKEEEKKNTNTSKYNELYRKYMDMERKCYILEKEKKEIILFIKKMNMNSKTNIKNIPNNEENINSLMELANKELEEKDNLIKNLKKEAVMADLSNIDNIPKEQLKKFKETYTNNLKLINEALKVYQK